MATPCICVSQNARTFRRIAKALHKKYSHVTFDRIVNELLDSEHGYLMSEASLEDIAYLYDGSRQRIQQIQNTALKRIRMPTRIPTKHLFRYAQFNPQLSIQIGK